MISTPSTRSYEHIHLGRPVRGDAGNGDHEQGTEPPKEEYHSQTLWLDHAAAYNYFDQGLNDVVLWTSADYAWGASLGGTLFVISRVLDCRFAAARVPLRGSIRDEDGYLCFVSRADYVIITSGYRDGPMKVEIAIPHHPTVEQIDIA